MGSRQAIPDLELLHEVQERVDARGKEVNRSHSEESRDPAYVPYCTVRVKALCWVQVWTRPSPRGTLWK